MQSSGNYIKASCSYIAFNVESAGKQFTHTYFVLITLQKNKNKQTKKTKQTPTPEKLKIYKWQPQYSVKTLKYGFFVYVFYTTN